jgi:catechol 2,3-dioxygenase-like lactoylglutathione lyase family enzyme
MLKDAHPIAFVMTSDYEHARAFYEGVLGLEVVTQDVFALKLRVGATSLRLVKLAEVAPTQHTVFGFEVADVPAVANAMAAQGVVFERYEFLGPAQGADGVWTSPDGSQVAWFKDPDSNVLSISSAR